MNIWGRQALLAAVTAVGASCGANVNHPKLLVFPDGKTGYSLNANSAPFMKNRTTEEQVLEEAVARQGICPEGYATVSLINSDPSNYSLVVIDAVIKCKGRAR